MYCGLTMNDLKSNKKVLIQSFLNQDLEEIFFIFYNVERWPFSYFTTNAVSKP